MTARWCRGQALRRPVFGADVDAVAARDEIGERGEEVIATRIEGGGDFASFGVDGHARVTYVFDLFDEVVFHNHVMFSLKRIVF